MQELARLILPSLSEHQRRMAAACVLDAADVRKVTAAHLTQERLAKYLKNYFDDPLAIVRRQNEFIRALKSENRKPFFTAATQLNYLAERDVHVRPYDEPGPKTHEQRTGIEYLFHGDLLPGTRFILARPSTHDREYLKIKKESKNTLPYTIGARMLAAQHTSELEIAKILLAQAVHEKGGEKIELPPRAMLGAASIRAMGSDVCRHKGALLALCLQEAGIKSRYVRGDIDGINHRGQRVGGRHVWVEAQLDGRKYRLDPQWGLLLDLEQSRSNKTPAKDNPVYAPDARHNVLWRRKRRDRAA